MGWKTTSVVTTQVMDENPMTWLNAATTAFKRRNYAHGIEYADQALRLSGNNQDIVVRAYAYKILLNYGLGDISSARSLFQSQQNDKIFRDYLFENCDIIVAYTNFDLSFWGDYWKNTVRRKAQEQNVDFFKKYKTHIDDTMFAEVCDNNFLFRIMEDNKPFVRESLLALLRVNYPLSQAKDKDGKNLLMTMAGRGNKEAVQLLLDNNINDINSCDNKGNTPLMYAVRYKHLNIIKFLVERGANVRQDGKIPLLVAAVFSGSKKIVEFLLTKDVNINVCDRNGHTPLFYAFLGNAKKEYKNFEIAKLLVNYGAEINYQYPFIKNRTILQEIAAGKHWFENELWRFLLEQNVCIDAQDEDGMTALMLSLDHSWFFSDELDFAKALVAKGASMDIRAKNGENAWDIIRRRNIKWK